MTGESVLTLTRLDTLNNSVKPFDHVPHMAPYELITGAGGFTDEWLEWAPANEGWTSGWSVGL